MLTPLEFDDWVHKPYEGTDIAKVTTTEPDGSTLIRYSGMSPDDRAYAEEINGDGPDSSEESSAR